MISVFGITINGFIHLLGFAVIGWFILAMLFITVFYISSKFQEELYPVITASLVYVGGLIVYAIFLIVSMYKLIENML